MEIDRIYKTEMKALRGTYICEILSRERKLPSGLYLADKMKSEAKDNICKCVVVGEPLYRAKDKYHPVIAKEGDIIHFTYIPKSHRFEWDGKKYLTLTNNEISAIERGDKMIAPLSRVIVKLVREENVGKIILSDGAKVLEGEFYGKVIAVGEDYPDKDLKIEDEIIFLRNEGHVLKTFETREEYLSVKAEWIYGKRT